jgi:hypothetical protein
MPRAGQLAGAVHRAQPGLSRGPSAALPGAPPAVSAQQGRQGRSYHLLKHLAERHRCTWAPSSTTPTTRHTCHPAPVVRRPACVCGCTRARAPGQPGRPGQRPGADAALLPRRRPARWVAHTLARSAIDAAVVFSSSMAQYAQSAARWPAALVDFVDVDSAKWTEYAERHPGRCPGCIGARAGGCWPTSAKWLPRGTRVLRHRQGDRAVPPPGARMRRPRGGHGQRGRRRVLRARSASPVAVRRASCRWCSPAPWTTGPTSTRSPGSSPTCCPRCGAAGPGTALPHRRAQPHAGRAGAGR